jgi:hypothetical protein
MCPAVISATPPRLPSLTLWPLPINAIRPVSWLPFVLPALPRSSNHQKTVTLNPGPAPSLPARHQDLPLLKEKLFGLKQDPKKKKKKEATTVDIVRWLKAG